MSYLGTKPQTATQLANSVVTTESIADGAVTPSDLSTGHPNWDTSGNVGIGTSSPAFPLDVSKSGGAAIRLGQGFNLYNSDNTNNYYMYNSGSSGAGNATLLFVQGGVAERMRIDSSGRVTMPYQPAFRARRSIGAFSGAGVIRFDSADYNRGSHYNSSNGVFTAPVGGAYLFCYNIETQGSGNNFLIRPRKNGSTIVVTEIQISTSSTSGFCYSLVVDMAANDTFDLYLDSGYTIYGNANYTFMSGCLLG